MAGLLSRYFGFEERQTDLATEVRAGLTTFIVMAYIIFVNPIILGFTGVPGLDGKGLPFAATLTVTCLAAGVLSIGMGLASNYPFALAAGMGLNAVVAFDLVAGRGLSWPQAMTVVFLEGTVITVLVLTRFREALMEAVPIGLKRAISFGIGLFGKLGAVTASLVIFPIMLSDFFDTMGTIIGVGGRGGFLDKRGQLPRANRVLLVDSLGALFGGFANSSSNTTYIESAAGVTEGARTGLASVVTGLLFLGAMFFSPLASVIPAQATAPALIIVGFFMMGIARDIPWDDYEEAIPAFMTMLVMPFTWSITNGIGAGFVTYAAIKLLRGRGAQLHWMVYVACAAFIVYFCLPLIEGVVK